MTGMVHRADAVPLYGPRYDTDPHGMYEEIRAKHGPVAPVLLEGDVPAWFVCGYRELHQVTSDSQLFARDPRLAGLQITQFVIDDGWLGLAVGPRRTTAATPAMAR